MKRNAKKGCGSEEAIRKKEKYSDYQEEGARFGASIGGKTGEAAELSKRGEEAPAPIPGEGAAERYEEEEARAGRERGGGRDGSEDEAMEGEEEDAEGDAAEEAEALPDPDCVCSFDCCRCTFRIA